MEIAANKSSSVIAIAGLYAWVVLVLGYVLLGLLPMILFAFGFLGGLFLWLFFPTDAPFKALRVPPGVELFLARWASPNWATLFFRSSE